MKIPLTALPVLVVSLGVLLPCIVGPPVIPEEAKEPKNKNDEMDLGLEYERYLKQVVAYLEQDKDFRDKLGSAKMEDITSGKIAHELQFVSHGIRTQLDELKRKEMARLRRLARQENELSNGIDRRMVGMPLHLDVKNEHTFEVADLRNLVQQTTRDLEALDRRRKDEFKTYEMEKEHKRREELKQLDEEKRKQAEQEYMEKQKRHKDHPKLHHPGSKQQLEEVWEQEDQMPTEEFNPKTFFRMHDLDGDEFWNQEEVMSLFEHELDKMYTQNNTDDDMQERREEMDRMREHVVNETDSNKDGLISIAEFLDMTRRNEFNQDPGWQGLDETEMYRDEELQQYERQYQAGMIPPGGVPMYVPEGVHPGAGYQHLPPNQQMGGQYPQQGYPQPIPPGPYDHQMPNYQGGQQQYQQQHQYQQGYPQGQVPQYQQGYPQGQMPQYQGGPPQGHVPQYQGGPPQGHVPQYQGSPQDHVPQHQGGPPQGHQQGAPQQHNGQQQPPPHQFQNAVPQQGLPQQPLQQQQQQQQSPPPQRNLPNAQVPPQQSSTDPPQPLPPQTAEAVTGKPH